MEQQQNQTVDGRTVIRKTFVRRIPKRAINRVIKPFGDELKRHEKGVEMSGKIILTTKSGEEKDGGYDSSDDSGSAESHGIDNSMRVGFGNMMQRLEQRKKGLLGPSSAAAAEVTAPSNKYVPPRLRKDVQDPTASASSTFDEKTATNVKVTNLCLDTEDDDLRGLFSRFGPLHKVHILRSSTTGKSRGIGFINFRFHNDAANAIQRLHGHGFDNSILHVEWALPRP